MRPRVFEVVRDCAGAAFLEFALVLPVLLLVMFGIMQFGLIFYHYIMVTNGAAVGARQFSISRLDTTPYTDTVTAIQNATTLGSNVTITLKVNNAACTTNSQCQTDLQNAYLAGSSPPEAVSVQVQFSASCSFEDLIEVPGFPIHLNLCPTSTMQAPVQ